MALDGFNAFRSMGDPEIKKLQEMVDMIPEDDFQSLKKN